MTDPGGSEPPARSEQLLRDVAYLPPERARNPTACDIPSDLYCMGATVYALLTGRAPFEGKSLPETITKVLQDEPVRPKDFQLSLPDAFEQVVLRLLAKKPELRPQSAQEVREELERVAAGGITPSMPPVQGQVVTPEGVIPLTCACGQRLQARKKYAGTRVRCPGCGTFLTVPGTGDIAAPTMPAQLATPTQAGPAPVPKKQSGKVVVQDSPRPQSGPTPEKKIPLHVMIGAVVILVVFVMLAFVGGSCVGSRPAPASTEKKAIPGGTLRDMGAPATSGK